MADRVSRMGVTDRVRRAGASFCTWVLALSLGLPVASWGQTASAAESSGAPAVAAQALGGGVYYVEGLSALGSAANQNFISNAGFVITPAGVVVVDALGSPALAERLIAEVRRLTDKPITHVVVTHYHADHVYGLQAFQAAGAKLIAHRAAQEYIGSETARLRLEASRQELAPWINAQTRLVQPDIWIDSTHELNLGGVLVRIVPVGPSHTPEDVVVHLPQQRVLFAGDLVFRNRIPFVGQADSRRWIRALEQLLSFEAQAVVPGHGPVSTQARADMQLTRDYLAYLRQVMGKAARNMEPFDEAYRAADWSRFEALPLFRVANRMNAYNTYLLMERQGDD